ncbi:ATP-binding protein [uncultured Flavobacterium sp.]|uniref:ATP-binding protein n=1 Tax=uncultured Flavobacterium sp. TaxID=165435 RepID=UPI0030EDDAFC|tara:strand:- start:30366 stop:32372 length:2007 start_codon:yes stop_codon:yes gene_type:complete
MGNSKNDKSKSAPPDPILMDSAEAKFQNLISQAPVLIVTYYGPTFIIQTINKIALSVWKKSYDEVINKPLFDVAPELEDSLTKILNDIYTTGEPFIASEIPVEVKRTGKPDTAYFNMLYKPMRDLDNKIYGIILIGTEVTETVIARKQIEESEKRFSNILSQSLMAVAIFTGPDMLVTFANEQMLNVLGKGNDILDKPLLEGVPELKNQAFPQLLLDVYTTGVAFEGYETKAILVRNGVPVHAYFNFVYQPYRDLGDTIIGITVLATEVTEQVLAKKQIETNNEEIKKIASHLKLATDSAKVGIWSLDLLSSKLEWSNVHKKMWGYDENREDLTYEHWYAVILPEDREMALQKVEQAKVFPGIYEVDYRITRANDGALVFIKSTGLYHYDKFGIAHTFTGITIDISEQKRIDAELIEAKRKAEADKKVADHAVMAKQQFLSNMSHEIRTPMNAIIGFTKVLIKTDLNEKQKDYLQAIKSSGDTLIVLIDDILDLAKVDAGKMIFINAPFKMSQSITTILHLFETKIQEKNLELVKEYDSRIPEILLGDSVRLHQIMINLLGNAIKFTAKGTINVSVSLLSEAEENVTVEIKVTDSGIGIPATKIASIFENFEQAHTITSSLYGGTGLGLAIVKQLVEKQGGAISVKSKVDEGSTFSFTLSFQKKTTRF